MVKSEKIVECNPWEKEENITKMTENIINGKVVVVGNLILFRIKQANSDYLTTKSPMTKVFRGFWQF